MKFNLHKKNGVRLIAGLALASVVVVGCTDDDFKDKYNHGLSEVNQFFDYSTEKELNLNVQYQSPKGMKVRFEVFTQNPTYKWVDEANEANFEYRRVEGLKPIAAGYTDENGRFDAKIKVSASVDELYFWSDNLAVPQLYKANANASKFNITFQGAENDTRALSDVAQAVLAERTELISGYVIKGNSWNNVEKNNLHTIFTNQDGTDLWYTNGAPSWSDEPEELSQAILDATNVVRANQTKGKPADFLKKHLLKQDFEVANTGVVRLQVVSTTCAMRNALAYYVYDKSEAPTTLDELHAIKKYLILPFASSQTSMVKPRCLVSPSSDNQYVDSETITLINPKTNTTTFDAGQKIGFMLLPGGYAYDETTNIATVKYGDDPNYTTAIEGHNFVTFPDDPAEHNRPEGYTLTSYQPCQLAVSVKVKGVDYYEVFGFEDQKSVNATDADFDDLVFGLSNIKGTEHTGDPDPVIFEKKGLLLYEDNWPKVGDYDMNDVVSEYHVSHAVNEENELIESIYQFKVLWAGALYHNQLAMLLPADYVSSVSDLADGVNTISIAGTDNGASNGIYVNICGNTNDFFSINGPRVEGAEPCYKFKVTYNENTPITVSNYFNPFIMVRQSTGNVEVHLIGEEPSSIVLSDDYASGLFNTMNDNSYTEQADGKSYWYAGANYLPFAINVVDTDGSVLALDFYKQEGYESIKNIGDVFPNFGPWAGRKPGYENCEWWK